LPLNSNFNNLRTRFSFLYVKKLMIVESIELLIYIKCPVYLCSQYNHHRLDGLLLFVPIASFGRLKAV